MSEVTSQETVARLKALLFDQESRELDTLAGRMADLHARAGSDEHFQRSVAKVLDLALREAESSRHKELADAMSPMVLRTLRAEMKSADMQDQIAGIMYPRMGEMVARYVSSAIRDMMQEINRRLEGGLSHNRLVMRLRSLASGRSMAELALADTQRLEVAEIYLVRRGSGILVHHWQSGRGADPEAGGNRDTLVSGFLAAISALAEDAFEADKDSLRTLELDDHRIFLRGSPDYLLAAKCSGSTPVSVDRLFDAELVRVLDEHRAIERAVSDDGAASERLGAAKREDLLADLAARIEAAAADRTREMSRRHGARTMKILLWIVGLPLLVLLGWYLYVGWVTSQLQQRADASLAAIPELTGYPVKAHVERGGRRIWVTGLAPDETTRLRALGRLKEIAPQAQLSEAIGILPQSDVDARLGAEGLRRSLDRAQRKLSSLLGDLATASDRLPAGEDADLLRATQQVVRGALSEVETARRTGASPQLDQTMQQSVAALRAAADRHAAVVGADPIAEVRAPADTIEAAEALVLAGDRIATLVATLEQRRAVAPIARQLEVVGQDLAQRTAEVDRLSEQRLAVLNQRLEARIRDLERRLEEARPAPTTPQQRLETFIRANAVFFSNDNRYRDAAAAEAMLDELAQLVQSAGLLIRVVGYTDEAGGLQRNAPLAQSRADKVAADLVARGIPPQLLAAVGRVNAGNLATVVGTESPNRRVEFEIAFKGERGNAE